MREASQKSKFYLGAFTVLMLLVVGFAFLFAGQDLTFFKSRSRYFVAFKNTSGLQPGAPIKMGGVDIGNVENIAISQEKDVPQILATLIVYAPHDALVKVDSEASMETQGMLGDKFLNITPGSAGSERLPPQSFIKASERLGLAAVVSRSTDIVDSVGKATQRIDSMTASLPDQKTIKEMSNEMRDSVHALHLLLKELNSKQSAFRVMSDPATSKKISTAVDSLQSASKHFESVAKKIDEGHGTLGALVNDVSLYDDMRALMGRANRSKAARFVIHKTLEAADGETQKGEKAR